MCYDWQMDRHDLFGYQQLMTDFALARSKMIESQVRPNGITDGRIIQAMASFTQNTGLTWEQGIEQQPAQVQTILAASWH